MAVSDIPVFELPPDFVPSHVRFQECLEAGSKYGEIRSMPESHRGDTWEADRRRASAELMEANTNLDVARNLEQFAWEAEMFRLGMLNPPRPESQGPQVAFGEVGDLRSPGQQFIEMRGDTGLTNMRESDGIEVRNLLGDVPPSNSGVLLPVGSPTLSGVQRRRFYVRDLIPVIGTTLSSVPYIREVSAMSLESSASAVAEASAKPEVDMLFEQDDAPMRKIAAWIQATMEALDDQPILRGYIDGRLSYMLQIREEFELLSGGGTVPHIKGILDFTGGPNLNLQTLSSTSDMFVDVGVAIGKIEKVDLDADGVVVNPHDYWDAITNRSATWFDGSPGNQQAPFGTPGGTIWGLPAVRSRACSEGSQLVGAFGTSATIFQREGTTIRTTDSHASLFISNTWVILAEERVGLAVHRPDGFVLVS